MVRIFKRLVAAVLCFAAALSFASCEDGKNERNSRSFYGYFDTVGTLYDYTGMPAESFEAVADELVELLAEYHRLFDIYNEYEGIANLATLNANAGRGAVKLDPRVIELLSFAKETYALTGGEVNVALGSVLAIWHEYREAGVALPTRAELEEAARHTNIDDLVIDEAAGTAELVDPNMRLDVGAVAKGFAVEKLALRLKELGLSGWAIDVGGNIRVVGEKPDGGSWRVGIANPDKSASEPYIAYRELRDSALVTSGSYERFYTVDGVRYHHIIDKDTLFPSTLYASVSVEAPSSALADALSTALFCMELDEAKALLDTLSGVSAIFVTASGTVVEYPAASS